MCGAIARWRGTGAICGAERHDRGAAQSSSPRSLLHRAAARGHTGRACGHGHYTAAGPGSRREPNARPARFEPAAGPEKPARAACASTPGHGPVENVTAELSPTPARANPLAPL